MNRALSSFKPI